MPYPREATRSGKTHSFSSTSATAEESFWQNPALRKYAPIPIAILVVLLLLEFFVLRGDVVFRETGQRFAHAGTQTFAMTLDRVGEEHTVELGTRKHEVKLSWKLVGPQGQEVESGSEIVRHSGDRQFSFDLTTAGKYELTVKRERRSGPMRIGGPDRDRIDVRVLVGAHRVLAPLFNLFKF